MVRLAYFRVSQEGVDDSHERRWSLPVQRRRSFARQVNLILDHRFLLRCARRLSEYEQLIERSLADSRWKRKPRHSLAKYVVRCTQFGNRRARLEGGGRKRKFPDAVAKLRSRTKPCHPRRPHAIFKSPFERV